MTWEAESRLGARTSLGSHYALPGAEQLSKSLPSEWGKPSRGLDWEMAPQDANCARHGSTVATKRSTGRTAYRSQLGREGTGPEFSAGEEMSVVRSIYLCYHNKGAPAVVQEL